MYYSWYDHAEWAVAEYTKVAESLPFHQRPHEYRTAMARLHRLHQYIAFILR